MKKRKRLDFKVKILVSNILLFFLFISVVFFYFYHYVVQEQNRKAVDNLYHTSFTLNRQLETILYNADNMALQIASNPFILDIFSKIPPDGEGNYFKNDSVFYKQIETFLMSYNLKESVSDRICLYNSSEDFIYCGVRLVSEQAVSEFFKEKFSDTIEAYYADGDVKYRYFIPPREDPFSISETYGEDEQLFSVVRQMRDYALLDSPACGYVEVQMTSGIFEEIFTGLPDGAEGFLLNRDGEIIYGTDLSIPETVLKDFEETSAGFGEMGENEDYYWAVEENSDFEINLLLTQNKKVVFEELMQFWKVVLTVLSLTFIVLCGAQYMVMYYAAKPLVQLKKSVDAIEIGNLSWELVEDNGNNDLERLNLAFQQMVEKLQAAIDELVESQTAALKAQLLALQAQMDPHFMHNILTIITMEANEGKVEDIPIICKKLSSMLYYTADYQDSMVPIKQEFEYVQGYLELMKIRYESHLQYEINLALDEVIVPKLIVQPLVENCFKHGFKAVKPPWKIRVRGYTEDTFWYVTVEDNGSGFVLEKLETFQQFVKEFRLSKMKNQLSHMQIGELCLTNIYIRLYLRFGNQTRFFIESSQEGKTMVKIGGPL